MLSVGVDEAGRGCIFGPVYAAAVIWNDEIDHKLLKDSKKLTNIQRRIMYDFIIDNAIDYSYATSSESEIDKYNILQATQRAMHKALDALYLDFDHINVDGNYFNYYYSHNSQDFKPHSCLIKGDSIMKSISAASIIAKVEHDKWILEHSSIYPEYKLNKNMGYCTKDHIEAVKTFGRTICHRYTFKLPFEKI